MSKNSNMTTSVNNTKTPNMLGNSGLLLLTATIWGMAFVAQSKGMEYMGAFTFNGARSIIGAFSLMIYIFITRVLTGKGFKDLDMKITLVGGVLCGIAITVASNLQQIGIMYTTVGKSGFITALYIIFVPILGIFLKKKVSPIVWGAALLAVVGLYLLCITESFSVGLGDILVLLCAVVFAIQIMIVDHYSPKTDGAILSCLQFLVCGIISSIAAFIFEEPTVAGLQSGISTLLYAGVMSCGIAYTLQIVAQKNVNPTAAALIMSLESVVASVAGWAAYKLGFLTTDQSMTGRQVLGCIIVFAAVILVQLPAEWFAIGTRKTR